MNKLVCKVCGRELKHKNKKMLCAKHLNEYNEFGFCITTSDRTENEPNEIRIHNDYAEIVLYDIYQEEIEEKILIDIEDIDIVKNVVWKKVGKHIVGSTDRYTFDLPSLLMDTDNKIEYVNGNILDNRKENLMIVEKKKFKHHFANNKKYKNKIIITSLGGSTEDVTGSCFAIEYPLDNGGRDLILLECGSIQTNRMVEDFNANKKMVDNIPFNLASNIFVCHCHADHIANIPSGITRGFDGNVVTTYETAQLLSPMLLDSAFIQKRNIISMNSKGKKYEMLYDESDVFRILDKIKIYDKEVMHKINSNLSFRFVSNNHCFGSTSLEIFIKKPSGRIVKIFYSSDLGSSYNQQYKPYCDERRNVSKANIAIFESTYGDRGFSKKDVEKDVEELLNKIREVTYKGNRILIPCFSFDRSQSIMDLLYHTFKDEEEFKNIKVIVDSRLTNEINKVYEKTLQGELLNRWEEVMSWDNFIFIDEYKKTELMARQTKNPCVIISSSGMLAGGHSVAYAKHILPRKQDCICFIGYCSERTLGGKIQRGAKSVTIENKSVPIRCEVNVYNSFTGHIQRKELISYMKGMNCSRIFVHHGSEDAKAQLKFTAEEDFLFSGISKKIGIINKKNNCFVI